MHKRLLLLACFLLQCLGVGAQSIGQEHQNLAAFLKRMYLAAPFEGVKIVEDYDNQYLISVIALEKAKYVSDRAHGTYGKETLPHWARGGDIGGNVARSLMV
jgi:hypothetical protein